MARKRQYQPLSVLLNGQRVGQLSREPSGAIAFQYDAAWFGQSASFAVSLALPLREDRYTGAPVFAVFDNLLPDGEPIRRHIAERVGAQGVDPFHLLAALGHDCVGALQFVHEDVEPEPAGGTKAREISETEIAEMIRNLGRSPLGVGGDESFRISLAGAQEKTALMLRDGRWYKPIGTTATTHIIKPQIGMLPNGMDLSNRVENEYLCLKLVAALGVPAAQAEIAMFENQKALVVTRFDRRWHADGRLFRLPQEDCCQALSIASTRKYQSEGGPGIAQIVGLLKGSDRPDQDIAAFMRANVIFWLLGATDGHAKNFSIFLNPTGFRMTPLYDVISAQPSLAAGQIQRKQFKLAMSAGERNHHLIPQILPRHYLQTAKQAGFSATAMNSILEDLRSTAVATVDRTIQEVGTSVPGAVSEPILEGVKERVERLGMSEA